MSPLASSMKKSSIIRESVLILLLSIFIGFTYTYVRGKGFFADSRAARARPSAPAAELIDVALAR